LFTLPEKVVLRVKRCLVAVALKATYKRKPQVTNSYNSEHARRVVTEDIRFADTPIVVDQQLTGSSLLQCVATGTPQPEVSWWFHGKKIVPGINVTVSLLVEVLI